MSAKYVSSHLIKTVHKARKVLAVESVDRTTAWIRPSGFPVPSVTEDFVQIVEEHAATFKPETTKIAMKKSEHQSKDDKRVHYTAYGLDKDNNVIEVRHFTKNKS